MSSRIHSEKIFRSLFKNVPGGVNSPVRACQGILSPPFIVESGKEDLLIDAEGSSYIDYCGSWGSLIHGHAHPFILAAVQKRIEKGTSFGISTSIEDQLAAKMIQLVPALEQIRCVSSGTEATMSAVRLARGHTKREWIIKFSGNYHGHADFFLVQAGSGVTQLPSSSSSGIPEGMIKQTLSLPYNDKDCCLSVLKSREWEDKIAAVIIEPIAGNMGVVPAEATFLQLLREETKRIGALLIFDEVISGFRVARGGAQELYGIEPDLSCFGKIMGGGFPAAAFGGKKQIMDDLAPLGHVYQAGTLSGNPIAMEAGFQALSLLEGEKFYERLEEKTRLLTDPIEEFIKKKNLNCCLQRVGSMLSLFFGKKKVSHFDEAKQIDREKFIHFFRFLFDRGVYIPPSPYETWFVSTAHTVEHLRKTANLILQYLSTY